MILCIYFSNAESLVDEILELTQVNAKEKVTLADSSETTIKEALIAHLDITETTPQFVRQYAEHLATTANDALSPLLDDAPALSKFIQDRPPIFIFKEYPSELKAQQLHDLLDHSRLGFIPSLVPKKRLARRYTSRLERCVMPMGKRNIKVRPVVT